MTPSTHFSSMMKNLLLDGEWSDLQIVCRDRIFKVHRVIVCTQSPFFKDAVNEDSKGAVAVVNLYEEDSEAVRRVLSYLYTENYDMDNQQSTLSPKTEPATPLSEQDETEDAVLESMRDNTAYKHFQVLLTANKFGIDSLKKLSQERFIEWMSENWSCAAFPGILRYALTHLSSEDTYIAGELANILSARIDTFIQSQPVMEAIKEFNDFQHQVMIRMVSSKQRVNNELNAVRKENQKLTDTVEGGKFGRRLSAMSRCQSCSAEFHRPFGDAVCPRCGSRNNSAVS